MGAYFRDPDGNGLEFQIDLMEEKDANEFMSGPAFAANPIGEPFDPEALAARLAQGQPVNDLIFRSDQAESKALDQNLARRAQSGYLTPRARDALKSN